MYKIWVETWYGAEWLAAVHDYNEALEIVNLYQDEKAWITENDILVKR